MNPRTACLLSIHILKVYFIHADGNDLVMTDVRTDALGGSADFVLTCSICGKQEIIPGYDGKNGATWPSYSQLDVASRLPAGALDVGLLSPGLPDTAAHPQAGLDTVASLQVRGT